MFNVKINYSAAGEMAQMLRGITAEEEQGLVPSIYMGAHNHL